MNMHLINTAHASEDAALSKENTPMTQHKEQAKQEKQTRQDSDALYMTQLLLSLDKALKRLAYREAQNQVKDYDLASIRWLDVIEESSENLNPIQDMKKKWGIISRSSKSISVEGLKSEDAHKLPELSDALHTNDIKLNRKKTTNMKHIPRGLHNIAKSTSAIAVKLERASDTLEALLEEEPQGKEVVQDGLSLWLVRELAGKVLNQVKDEAETFSDWMSFHGFKAEDITALFDNTSGTVERSPAEIKNLNAANIADWVVRMGETKTELNASERADWDRALTDAGFNAAEVWDVIELNQKKTIIT